VRLGVGLNSLAQAGFAIVPPILGLCALAAFPHLSNPELALPTVMMNLLPKWLGIWTLASVFSAELSATDAILFMLSTSLAVDLYRTFLNPQVSDKKLLLVSRLAAVIAGGAGIVIAELLSSVVAAVSIFWIVGGIVVCPGDRGFVLEEGKLPGGVGRHLRRPCRHALGIQIHAWPWLVGAVAASHRNHDRERHCRSGNTGTNREIGPSRDRIIGRSGDRVMSGYLVIG